MKRMAWSSLLIALSMTMPALAFSPAVKFIVVEKDVRLEVVDWGGTGRPLIFLAGMGNDAHEFDRFAPKFTHGFHVYGITRRGFGASSKPAPAAGNYTADRLGDDVLAVMDSLKLDRPILVGHSLAGQELSSVGSRHPEKVRGLIYLDAGYGFSFYDREYADYAVDIHEVKKKIEALEAGGLQDENEALRSLESSALQLSRSLAEYNKLIETFPSPPPRSPIVAAISYGEQKYTRIDVPILAIFAVPRFRNAGTEYRAKRAKAFEKGLPKAHVVYLANADHYVFNSNEAEVLREMNTFLANLP